MALSAEIFKGLRSGSRPPLFRQELTTPPTDSKTERTSDPEDLVRFSSKVPQDLKVGKEIDTPAGTWYMKDFGGTLGKVAIFESEQHLKAQESYPHVDNINDYANSEIEAEIAKPMPIPTIRRPLSIRRIASFFPLILG